MDPGLVEVEWVGEDRRGLRKSALTAAARVAFESVLPARRFSSYRGQRHFPGWYWAATTGSLVGFESWLERDRLMLLDHDRHVAGLASQPFRVTWQGATRRISHTPDYFARLVDGAGLVIDVRPAHRVKPEDAEKFSATEAMCRAIGCWTYVLVHEPEPVLMANIRWLSGYRHPRYRVGAVVDRLREVFGRPRMLVEGASAAGDPLVVLPTLFHLLWCGDLSTELTAPLDDGSLVSGAEASRG